jgi:hypothetical protein
MKTVILSAAVALFSLSASASGSKEKSNVSFRCIQNFEREFGYIEDVKWSNSMNYMSRAEFVQDDEKVTAYFDETGEYVASTCTMKFDQLPKMLRNRITDKLPTANVTTVFKVTTGSNVSYYFETEKDGEKKLYKGTEYGDFTRHYVRS